MSLKVLLPARKSWKSGYDWLVYPFWPWTIITSRSGCAVSKGRRIAALRTPKTTRLAAMATVRVRIAVRANPGEWRKRRAAIFKSARSSTIGTSTGDGIQFVSCTAPANRGFLQAIEPPRFAVAHPFSRGEDLSGLWRVRPFPDRGWRFRA